METKKRRRSSGPNPRKTAAALNATRIRMANARERRYARYIAEMEGDGYDLTVIVLDRHGGEVSFAPNP